MAKPDVSINPRILDSAKQEFLQNGYEKASLKSICDNARITTGALYKRYKGKEDLFCAVVEGTVSDLHNVVAEKCAIATENLSDEALISAWVMGESMLWWFNFLYERKEDFLLLIQHAAGTRYADFQHDWVDVMTEKSYDYFWEAKERGLATGDVSKREMHVLLSAFWTTVYEPFIHGFSWAEMEKHSHFICRWFNWQEVLGFIK